MKVVADTSVLLDFLDGSIADPYKLIRPYRMVFVSPVAFHEILRTYSEEFHSGLLHELGEELLPPPKLEHWIEAARVLRKLYPVRKEKNVARMQNDVLIALAARDLGVPVWSRDLDFEFICNHLAVGLLTS